MTAQHNAPYHVMALYGFTPIADPQALQAELRAFAEENDLCGTLILAREGFNGTLAAERRGALETLEQRLRGLLAPGHGAEIKYSHAGSQPFRRLKIKVKREIVTMGVADIDPTRTVGTYLDARGWNALLDDPDTVVIDTRNAYEYAIGTFRDAVDPGTRTFREFPQWVAEHRAALEGRKLAMFCTGGIRCEKATAFMKEQGFDEVYHLKGGILRYLEEIPLGESLWQGECFVFDERVAIQHGLAEGDAVMCEACGYPVRPEELSSPGDGETPSCPHCAAGLQFPNRRGAPTTATNHEELNDDRPEKAAG